MASLITRGKIYYIQWRVGKKIKRTSLKTTSYQVAKEKLLQFELARVRGEDSPLPTQTPLPEILNRYVEHVRAVKTPKSAQTDVYYLRQMFGPVCKPFLLKILATLLLEIVMSSFLSSP